MMKSRLVSGLNRHRSGPRHSVNLSNGCNVYADFRGPGLMPFYIMCENEAECVKSRIGDSRVAKFTIESGMAHISGFDPSQLLLLPEAIDDYVGMDNPVRFIDTFVEGVDLKAAGFERVEAKGVGRPGYAPGDHLTVWFRERLGIYKDAAAASP